MNKQMKLGRRLEGKVAVVTAATAGIGLAISERLALEGAHVVVSSRKQKAVDAAVAAIRAAGGEASGVVCHVGTKEHIENLVASTVAAHGRIDILVSNAAVSPGMGAILDLEEASWDKLFEINVKSAFMLCKKVVPHMPAGGSIIFVSSIAAYAPESPLGAYGVTKTALLGLTRALAADLGPRGIRVNCVAPGTIKTRFSAPLWESEEASAMMSARTTLGRIGEAGEIAGGVAYLVSDDASYVSGETLVIAGGVRSRL
jgi:dehydrogenase/reductase SDR family protein 4